MGAPPGDATAQAAAEACGLSRDALTLLHARTGCLAGMVQIAARVLECAIQKARVLGFPLRDLLDVCEE